MRRRLVDSWFWKKHVEPCWSRVAGLFGSPCSAPWLPRDLNSARDIPPPMPPMAPPKPKLGATSGGAKEHKKKERMSNLASQGRRHARKPSFASETHLIDIWPPCCCCGGCCCFCCCCCIGGPWVCGC